MPDGSNTLDRAQVSVLFAGIKGFRKYADDRDPAQAIHDLREYLSVAVSAIRRYGGEVDKFVGDAVIGVFRSTGLRRDHVERSVRAAAAIQETLRTGAAKGNPLFSMVGIGVSSGIVLYGHLAPGEGDELVCLGESFKIAYLLHTISGPGEVVLSRDVCRAMESVVSVEPLPPREMMERTGPWENFRLLKISEERKSVG